MISLKGFVCCMLVLVINSNSSHAQLYDKLVKECYKINSIFTDTGYLSLTIKYLVSTEKKPAVYTDTITSSLKVHRGNYYGKLNGTEYIQNKQYLVTIYAANSSILVSNPLKHNTTLLAASDLDSAFLASNIDSAWITESGQNKTIRFRFTNASSFKSYIITYNKTNYQLQKIVYSLKQKMFNPSDTVNLPANPVITVQFSGYSKAAFSDNIFSQDTYIKTDSSGQFSGAGSYKSYQVISTYQFSDTSKSSGFLWRKSLNANTVNANSSKGIFLLPGCHLYTFKEIEFARGRYKPRLNTSLKKEMPSPIYSNNIFV